MNLNINKKTAILIAVLAILSGGCARDRNELTNLSGDDGQITYASETKSPVEQLYSAQTIASFSTKFHTYLVDRNKNLTLAAKAINGKVVQPDGIFSFNEAVGPTTKRNGFRLAKIFVKGKESKGYGGGVCQVSSTLYNTATLAGMEIVERHPHTKKVHYVTEGRDAATSYGFVDFKFKNTRDVPVRISTLVKDDTLTVNLEALLPLRQQKQLDLSKQQKYRV